MAAAKIFFMIGIALLCSGYFSSFFTNWKRIPGYLSLAGIVSLVVAIFTAADAVYWMN